MANLTNSYPYSLKQTTPPQKVGAGLDRGKVRVLTSRVDLATINGGSAAAVNDTIPLFTLPRGAASIGPIQMASSASLGSSVLNFGITGNNDKYGIITYGTTANVVASSWRPGEYDQGVPLASDELVTATVLTANLPTSGVVVFRLEYAVE